MRALNEAAARLRVKGETAVRASRVLGDSTGNGSIGNGTAAGTSGVVGGVSKVPRYGRMSDSDEESMSEEEEPADVKRHPVIKTRPQSQIVGF